MSDLHEALNKLETQSRNDFRRMALSKILLPFVEGKRVLDVGCGMGFMTEKLVRLEKITISLDTELSFVKYTVQRTYNCNQSANGVSYAGDILPFKNNSFDTILVLDVIEHVLDDDRFIRELWRVLTYNGLLIIVIPAIQFLYGKRDKVLGHYRRYNKKGLKELLRNINFRIITINYWNLLGFFPYAFSELVLHREISDRVRVGNLSIFHKILVNFLSSWLILESKFFIPIGLSLISMSRKI